MRGSGTQNQETSSLKREFHEAMTALPADALLVWNHASYMSGKICFFEQRVLVKEPLCHCDHSDWSDLIFQLRTATSERPTLHNDERKKAPGAAYCTSSTWLVHWSASILESSSLPESLKINDNFGSEGSVWRSPVSNELSPTCLAGAVVDKTFAVNITKPV